MIKLLHCADIHLDSPFAADTPEKAALRRHELRQTFSAMMTYAKNNGIDIVLIAGDLFDREFVTRDTIAHVVAAFAANPACRFVISPGNHDPFTEAGVYAKTDFPKNVTIFSDETLSHVSFDDLGVDVYGYAFRSITLTHVPFAHAQPTHPERINLVCAHGSLGMPSSTACPISLDDITGSGFDYYALGHIHASEGISCIGHRYYGYSGCPEGRDFGECGYKGAYLVECDKRDGLFTATTKFLRFSRRRYEILSLNLTSLTDSEEGYRRIAEAFAAGGYGSDTSLRLVLEGAIAPGATLSSRRISSLLSDHVFALEIEDHTLPLFDEEALRADPTLRGAFYTALLPLLHDGTPEERECAALALRYGMSAMEGSDLSYD